MDTEKRKKYDQLQNIVRGGKKGYLERFSRQSLESITKSIAGSYDRFIADALTQIFQEGLRAYHYINGEGRNINDFRVKPEWMNIEEVQNRSQGLKLIGTIESYMQGDFGHMYSELLQVKRTPMQDNYYYGLMMFYYQLCKKYIFDIAETTNKLNMVREHIKVGLLGSKSSQAIQEYKVIFGGDDKDIFDFMSNHINKVLSYYVDYGEDTSPAPKAKQQTTNMYECINEYLSILQKVKMDIEERIEKGSMSPHDVMALGYLLNTLQYPKAKELIETIKKMCLIKQDFKTYSMFSYLTSSIGKKYQYDFEIERPVIGFIGGKAIDTILAINKSEKDGILFFDEHHYVNLSEAELVDVSTRSDKFIALATSILPYDIIGGGIQKISFGTGKVRGNETTRLNIRNNQKKIETQSTYTLFPNKKHFIYFKSKKDSGEKQYYTLTDNHDGTHCAIQGIAVTFTQLPQSTKDGDFSNLALKTNTFINNIQETSLQADYLAKCLQDLEDTKGISAYWLIFKQVKHINGETKTALKGHTYPSTYRLGNYVTDKFGKSRYIVLDAHSNTFELIQKT